MSDLLGAKPSGNDRLGEIEVIRARLDGLVSDLDESGDLERLERGLCQFNIFEALGAVNAELRHSNFLAWLFDPAASHGLGDVIVKRFLRRVLVDNVSGLSAASLQVMDLMDLEVRREWANTDLCLISESNGLVVVIENKINAAEGGNQLRSYRQRVERDFDLTSEGPPWKRLFLFLTIDGDKPSDDAYIPVSHRQVVDLLDITLKNSGRILLPGVATLIEHYTRMMRSHHMDESELIQLARKIYARHRSAFGFIFEHRPDAWSDAKVLMLEQLKSDVSLEVDPSTDRSVDVRWLPAAWGRWRGELQRGVGWKTAGSNAFMLCKLSPNKERNKAQLQLLLGPGPVDVREKLIEALRLAGVYRGNHSPKWTSVLKKPWRSLVADDENQAADPQEAARLLRQDIADLNGNEVPKIGEALARVFDEARPPGNMA